MVLKGLSKLIDHHDKLLQNVQSRLAEENSKLESLQNAAINIEENRHKQSQLFLSMPVCGLLTYQNFLQKSINDQADLESKISKVEHGISVLREEMESIFRDKKGMSVVLENAEIAAKKATEKRMQQTMEENFLLYKF